MNKTSSTYSGFVCSPAVSLLVQRKQGRTSEVAWRSLPVFSFGLFFYTPLAVFLSRRLTFTLSPLHPHPNLILHPLPQMSQTETAMEAEQPYEAETKVDLRDVSVDKTLLPPRSVGRTIFRANLEAHYLFQSHPLPSF